MRTIKEIHTFITDGVLRNAPDKWNEATFDIELLDNYSACKGNYLIGDVKTSIDIFSFPAEITEYFRQLHELTVEKEDNWNRAQYIIYPNGEFRVKFTWDDSLLGE